MSVRHGSAVRSRRGLFAATAVAACVAGCGLSHSSTTRSRTSPQAQGSLAALPTGATTTAATTAGASAATVDRASSTAASASPGSFFAASSPWNTPVATLPVDARSGAMLGLARVRTTAQDLAGDRGVRTVRRVVASGLFINTTAWTTPIVYELPGHPTRFFCRQLHCGPYARLFQTLSIPVSARPDPRYDGWFTVIDRQRQLAYDLWRARREADGSVSYEYAKVWSLRGLGFAAPLDQNAADAVSARGSGLPLFAGVILPAELRAGSIDHALAISLPGPASGVYVQPASATDGIGDQRSVPEGARLRLRAGVHLGRLPADADHRTASIILAALQRYGAIVVDRSAVPTLYGQKDVTAGLIAGDELQGVHISDFQVVRLPTRRYDPPRGASQAANGGGQGGGR